MLKKSLFVILKSLREGIHHLLNIIKIHRCWVEAIFASIFLFTALTAPNLSLPTSSSYKLLLLVLLNFLIDISYLFTGSN